MKIHLISVTGELIAVLGCSPVVVSASGQTTVGRPGHDAELPDPRSTAWASPVTLLSAWQRIGAGLASGLSSLGSRWDPERGRQDAAGQVTFCELDCLWKGPHLPEETFTLQL